MAFCRASRSRSKRSPASTVSFLIDDPAILCESGEFVQTARNRCRGSEIYALGEGLVLPSDQDRVFAEHTRHARVINFATEL